MKTVYTCITGSQHRAENKACQDVIVSVQSGKLTVTVLCDGAGSKKYGTESATLVAQTAAKMLAEGFYQFSPKRFIEQLNLTLENAGYNEQNAGTTLLFVAVDQKRYLVGHLGDGVILQRSDEGFQVASPPENGLLVNMTYFLPSSMANEHFRWHKGDCNGQDAFLLSSDGAASFLYDPQTKKGYNACNLFAQWAKSYSETECEEIMRTNLEQELAKYTGDDMSIAIMVTE